MAPVYSLCCVDEACACQFDTYLASYKTELPECPECKGPLKRVITSAPGVSLKGSGWAKDGYSVTDRGAQAVSDKADKKQRIVSFPGQIHKGRTGA